MTVANWIIVSHDSHRRQCQFPVIPGFCDAFSPPTHRFTLSYTCQSNLNDLIWSLEEAVFQEPDVSCNLK